MRHSALPLLFAAAMSTPARAQEPPVFEARVSQVHVDAEVLTEAGQVVTGLTMDDFRVFDEGSQQRIVACRTDEEPLDVILLIDTSGSMRLAPQKLGAAAHQALAELKRGDRVAVMRFDTATTLVSPFTEDLDATEQTILGLTRFRFRGGTYIHQAIDDAAQYLLKERRTRRRRAIVIVTDNVGSRTISEKRVVRDLWEADAVLSGLIFSQPGYEVRRAIVAVLAPYALIRAGHGMNHIAEETGRDTIRADEPGTAFPAIMHRLRTRYNLYYPTPEGEPGSCRSIRVELGPEARRLHPDARVYARRGYRLEPQ